MIIIMEELHAGHTIHTNSTLAQVLKNKADSSQVGNVKVSKDMNNMSSYRDINSVMYEDMSGGYDSEGSEEEVGICGV